MIIIKLILALIVMAIGGIISGTFFSIAKRTFRSSDSRDIKKRNASIFSGCIVILIAIVVFFLVISWVTIPAGRTGVYHLFGKVKETPLSSGFHLRNPIAQITQMSIRTEEYTMSIVDREGQKDGNDSIDALTKEGLKVVLDLTILYRLEESRAPEVYRELGTEYQDKVIRPAIRSAIRSVIANYEAKGIYSDKRAEVEVAIFDSIKGMVEERGIVLEKVMLRNVILPEKLQMAIEDKLEAEQQAQQMEFVLDKESKESERKAIEAQGIKTAQETIERTLTPEYLRWYSIEMMKQLANSPNTTFLFVPIDNNGMPIINLPMQ